MADAAEQAPDAVREGSRWRFARPSGEEVAEWFKTQPLDAELAHEDFIAGVVLIPATEKVKRQVRARNGAWGTTDSYELTYTPYVRVDTRVRYFHALAQALDLIAVIEPVPVPQVGGGPLANVHMPEGYWWYVTGGGNDASRYLCCTMRAALYKPEDYFEAAEATNAGSAKKLQPVRFGVSTKQVKPVDDNALAKAETGAIGRALGVAGILVIGTGIATAEDMAEATGQEGIAAVPALPEASTEAPESEEALNARCLALQATLQADNPEGWAKFAAWWQERRTREGWGTLTDAPVEVRRGVATRMEELLAEAPTDSSPAGEVEQAADGGEG